MSRKHRSEFFRPNGSDSDDESTVVEFAPEQFIDNLHRVEIDDVYFHSLEDGGEFSERSGGSESEGSPSNDDSESDVVVEVPRGTTNQMKATIATPRTHKTTSA